VSPEPCHLFIAAHLHYSLAKLCPVSFPFPKAEAQSNETAAMSFQRLVRFVNEQGRTLYGDLKSETPSDLTGVEVEVLEGDIQSGFKSTGRKDKISKLLCPLPNVPYVVCIGLNYQRHANEANVATANVRPHLMDKRLTM